MDLHKNQKTLADKLGKNLVEIQTIEECAEVTKVLCKLQRIAYGGFVVPKDYRDDLVEEIADVYAMLEMLCHVHNISSSDLEKIREEKIVRAFNRRGMELE